MPDNCTIDTTATEIATCTCCICNDTFPENECFNLDGDALCPDCYDEDTTTCSRCNHRIYRDDNSGDNDTTLCENCYDSYYHHCHRCNRLISNDDTYYLDDDEDGDDPYCYECHNERVSGMAIKEYDYRPEPIFHGSAPRYFGVELEIDEGGESNDKAESILSVANSNDENIYIKHDGSLRDGFEIVTHPMSLNYHIDEMPWREVLQKAIALHYQSHRTGTCGLHIHVSRKAFGELVSQQEAVIARILYFFEAHWNELLRFSRRTEDQLNRWAARYGYKDRPMDILDHAKKGYGNGRYSCINLQNHETIEFRIFRGTLKYNTVIATLQLVDAICDVAISMFDDEMQALSWTSFVARCNKPELVQYLKERRLYINEPIETEEDI